MNCQICQDLGELMYVNDEKMNELLDYIHDCCLICPPPYDYNDERWEGLDCPGYGCKECWKKYLSE